MGLSPEAQAFTPWFGSIAAGVEEGLTTHDLYSLIANSQIGDAVTVKLPTPQVMNELRHVAVLQREARVNLDSSPDELALNANHIAPNVIQETQTPASIQRYIARFQHSVMDGGVKQTVWLTSKFTSQNLPQTVGELRARLMRDAERKSADYEREFLELGSISLLAL